MVYEPDLLKNVSVLERSGAAQDDVKGYSLVVDGSGNILDVGEDEVVALKYADVTFDREIDATGKCVLPGIKSLFLFISSLLCCVFFCQNRTVTIIYTF